MARILCLGVCFALAGCMPLATKPVVKIGLVAPFEGFYRPLGYDVLYAVKLAVQEHNASSPDYMVQLVALDDSNDPGQAALQAEKMAIDQDVMVVVGGLSSQTALAAFEEYHRAGLAFIALSPADEVTERCYAEIFRLFAPNSILGREAADYAVRELGAARLAVLGEGDLDKAFAEEARRLRAAVVRVDTSEENWLAEVEGADLIFFGGEATDRSPVLEGAELARQVRKARPDAQFMGGSELGDPRVVQLAGETARGLLYITLIAADLEGHLTDPRAILAYDAARFLLKALAQAIERDGKPSREGVVTSLADIRHSGLSGAIAFDACGNWIDPPVHIRRIPP